MRVIWSFVEMLVALLLKCQWRTVCGRARGTDGWPHYTNTDNECHGRYVTVIVSVPNLLLKFTIWLLLCGLLRGTEVETDYLRELTRHLQGQPKRGRTASLSIQIEYMAQFFTRFCRPVYSKPTLESRENTTIFCAQSTVSVTSQTTPA